MALSSSRSASGWYSGLAISTVMMAVVIIPGFVRPCGKMPFAGRVLLLTNVAACAVTFLLCPRYDRAQKVLTLACFALTVFFAFALGGHDLVALLSDETAVKVLVAYQRLGF